MTSPFEQILNFHCHAKSDLDKTNKQPICWGGDEGKGGGWELNASKTIPYFIAIHIFFRRLTYACYNGKKP